MEARSFRHCYSGKAKSITQHECVYLLALGIQHALRISHFIICGLPGSKYVFTLSHKRHDFRKKKSYWTQNVCFDFLYNICLKHFSF